MITLRSALITLRNHLIDNNLIETLLVYVVVVVLNL